MSAQDLARRILHSAVHARLRPVVKAPFYLARSWLRRARRNIGPQVTAETLVSDLRQAGIAPGNVVCVHGSLSSLGNVRDGGKAVVAALKDAVGPEGTLLMPTYGSAHLVLSDGAPEVDLRTASSMTGILTEIFRTSDGAVRSSHPFSSVAAWGRQAAFVTGGHDTDPRICHPDSPLARFHQLGGKVLGIGITLGPVSFYHVVEDTTDDFPLDVYEPVRAAAYVDARGRRIKRPLARYRAELVCKRIDSPNNTWIRDRFTKDFLRRGILHNFDLGPARSWTIQSRDMFAAVHDLAQRGITIYTTPNDAAGA